MYKFFAIFAVKFIHPKNDPFFAIHKKMVVNNCWVLCVNLNLLRQSLVALLLLDYRKEIRLRERSENALKNSSEIVSLEMLIEIFSWKISSMFFLDVRASSACSIKTFQIWEPSIYFVT